MPSLRIAMQSEVIEAFFDKNALVVGDLMLDRFVYEIVDRISPARSYGECLLGRYVGS